MASFLKPADAVKAALAMRNEIAAFNAEQPDRALILKIGIHTGAAIAVTLNDDSIISAEREHRRPHPGYRRSGQDFLSEDVHADEEAAALLATMPVQSSKSKLRGMREDFRVFRIGSEQRRVG